MSSTLEIACHNNLPSVKQDTGGRIDRIMDDLGGRRVLVVGLGQSGYDATLFLLSRGARVRCTDSTASDALGTKKRRLEAFGAEVELGGHTGRFCLDCEMLVVSPGVDPSCLPLVLADSEGVPVISEMELGFRFCRSQIVGITGTNGKTTTCELTNHILREAGLFSATAGNIGVPLVSKVMEGNAPDVVVVEISSFQLERIHRFRPFISVVLNITDDHLDRYDSFQEYAEAKKRIAENQTSGDFLIVNENLAHLFARMNGRGVPTLLTVGSSSCADLSFGQGRIISRISGEEHSYEVCSYWHLRGDHNLENAAAAIAVAEILGAGQEAICSALSSFQGLHHRIEFVDEVAGVAFYDDSKATNVDAVVKALESFSQPVILIAGGRDKGGSYDPLREAARGKVKQAVLIGEAKEELMSCFDGVIPTLLAGDMEVAVELAFRNAERGEVVLLSPACSSFDMFMDYKHRGETFQRKVKQLKEKLEERRTSHEAA
jgi:UDP-N-acetylmuramoylalanine--D-glutamate ligase